MVPKQARRRFSTRHRPEYEQAYPCLVEGSREARQSRATVPAKDPSLTSWRCSGEIGITVIMQLWAATTAIRARRARGEAPAFRGPLRSACRRRTAVLPFAAGAAPAVLIRAANSSGSGRRPTSSGRAAAGGQQGPGLRWRTRTDRPGPAAPAPPHNGPGTDQVWSRDGADADRPHHDGEGAVAVFGVGEVDGGETRLEIGRRPQSEQGRPQQQHRKGAVDGCEDDQQGADGKAGTAAHAAQELGGA
jgi:hypothetical protein